MEFTFHDACKKVDGILDFSGYFFAVTKKDSHYIVAIVFRHAFYNCQTFVMADFESTIKFLGKEGTKDLVLQLAKRFGKPQLCVDVRKGMVEEIKKIWPEKDFLVESYYENNTGTKMCMCLIKVTHDYDKQ